MQNRLSKLKSSKAENIIGDERVVFSFLSDNAGFPLLIKPKSSGLILTEWVKDNMDTVIGKLNTHGALLFRGFHIDSVEKFQEFIDVFNASPLEYTQRSSPRYEVAKNIYYSTTYPNDQNINMHSENSYALNWPKKIVFCCIVSAAEQGETPIADNRLVFKNISQPTIDKFLQKGVRYVRNISKGIGLSWQEVFQTDDKATVEHECRLHGMDLKWEDDDGLVLCWNNKAIYNHPATNEYVWFNHSFFFNKYALTEEAIAAFGSDDELPFNTYFGDGSPITKQQIEEIKTAYDKATVVFPWQAGDVLFMDNMLMSHGRKPYKGDRKVIVSMF